MENRRPSMKCNFEGGTAAKANSSDNELSGQPTKRPWKSRTCYRCGRVGHLAMACTFPATDRMRDRPRKAASQNSNVAGSSVEAMAVDFRIPVGKLVAGERRSKGRFGTQTLEAGKQRQSTKNTSTRSSDGTAALPRVMGAQNRCATPAYSTSPMIYQAALRCRPKDAPREQRDWIGLTSSGGIHGLPLYLL